MKEFGTHEAGQVPGPATGGEFFHILLTEVDRMS